jgi:hypothetical protein
MDSQRLQAIQSLEISNDSVKSEKCGTTVALLRTLIKPKSNSNALLEKQIKWIENYSRGFFSKSSADEVKSTKSRTSSSSLSLCLVFQGVAHSRLLCPAVHQSVIIGKVSFMHCVIL